MLVGNDGSKAPVRTEHRRRSDSAAPALFTLSAGLPRLRLAAGLADVLVHERTVAPPPELVARARVTSPAYREVAAADTEGFWARRAAELLDWDAPWSRSLDRDRREVRWFCGGVLNACHNAVDRHVAAGHGARVAYHWEGEPGDRRDVTYAELLDEVQRFANVLGSLGVARGDRVGICMPSLPELPVAALACARIGAVHVIVPAGSDGDALAERLDDAGCTVLVTSDGAHRGGEVVPVKAVVDEALEAAPSVRSVVVVPRVGAPVAMRPGRDHWWGDLVAAAAPTRACEPMGSEDLLFLLHPAGPAVRGRAAVHTTGGYLTQVTHTQQVVFDTSPGNDVHWCTLDPSTPTGHAHGIWGPLCTGATSLLYEGAQCTPVRDRWWSLVERHRVSVLHVDASSARRAAGWGSSEPERHDLSRLRLVGVTGEPLDPDTWMWTWVNIGGGRCPVVSTWSTLETGAALLGPLPGVDTLKPGSATLPLPGVGAGVVDGHGGRVEHGAGFLAVEGPWPAMSRGRWTGSAPAPHPLVDPVTDRWVTGIACRVDHDGYLWPGHGRAGAC